MFQADGLEESLEPYADAFGPEPDAETCLRHFMENNKIPAGFLANPDDLASMAALLCSELSRFIVGKNIGIDGGPRYSIF